jgi:hypothetical protein
VPCRAVPCRAVPCRAVLCCAVLCCAVLCCALQQAAVAAATQSLGASPFCVRLVCWWRFGTLLTRLLAAGTSTVAALPLAALPLPFCGAAAAALCPLPAAVQRVVQVRWDSGEAGAAAGSCRNSCRRQRGGGEGMQRDLLLLLLLLLPRERQTASQRLPVVSHLGCLVCRMSWTSGHHLTSVRSECAGHLRLLLRPLPGCPSSCCR